MHRAPLSFLIPSLALSLAAKMNSSLNLKIPQMGFHQNLLPTTTSKTIFIKCGLRGGPRKPMWTSRVLYSEAIQAVQSLKLSKSSPDKLDTVFSTRLIKSDLLDTFTELQRQHEFDLAFLVFDFMRKEVWYKPQLPLCCDMIVMLGKLKQIEKAEEIFCELKREGLEPDTRTYSEMIGAYLQVGCPEKAIALYELMKASGCDPDKFTLTILIRNLEKAGEDDLAKAVKKDCVKYVDLPEKFLEQVAAKYPKRRSLKLV